MELCVFEPGAEAGGNEDETGFLGVDVGVGDGGGFGLGGSGLDRGGGSAVDCGAKEESQYLLCWLFGLVG